MKMTLVELAGYTQCAPSMTRFLVCGMPPGLIAAYRMDALTPRHRSLCFDDRYSDYRCVCNQGSGTDSQLASGRRWLTTRIWKPAKRWRMPSIWPAWRSITRGLAMCMPLAHQ